MTSDLIRKEKFGDMETQRFTEKKAMEDRGKHWNFAATNQKMPRIISMQQKLEEARNHFLYSLWSELEWMTP